MMIDHLKILPTVAIEVATNHPTNLDLQLVELDNLENCHLFKDMIRIGDINENTTLRKCIGLNTNFFYSIECVPNKVKSRIEEGCLYERGVGYLYQEDDLVFLKRTLPIVNGYSDNSFTVNNLYPRPFRCCETDSTVVVTCVTPQTYFEALVVPHSFIMSSEDSFIPTPLQVKKNSFLARLEGCIQNISFIGEEFVNIVSDAVCKFSKHLKLKASKLTVKRLETSIIDIKPSNETKGIKGSLVYDATTNNLMFYNGEAWKTVALRD